MGSGGKRAGAGRKKGVPNKLSTTVKENVLRVFEDIGGPDAMAEWATENKGQFYNIYAKMLPKTVEGDIDLGFHKQLSQAFDLLDERTSTT